jgi:ATP-binding cassette subfamily B protein
MDSDEYIKTVDPVRLPKKGKCSVEFKNVDFSYIEGIPVLRKISFRIEPGESLAIVGPTGAGKSSIINLICRFYDVNDGAVLIDGTDVRRVEPPELRKRIGLVLQDVFLFSGDIRKNIVLNNKEISDEVVYDVIERVNARGFIDNLPKRLDSVLGEGGLTLSAGQRQLLAFSRALVHDPDLLVLDEATASIDTETEEKIQAAIDHLVKGRTSIIIAHRLSTVQKADKIMVIDEGRIVEMGTHEQLLKKKGIYYGLYSLA